jgi:hypothetical protein
LNRFYPVARRATICAQTVDSSLDALAIELGRALKGLSGGSRKLDPTRQPFEFAL